MFEARAPDGSEAFLDRVPQLALSHAYPGELYHSWTRSGRDERSCEALGSWRLGDVGAVLVEWRVLPCGKMGSADWITVVERRLGKEKVGL